MAAARRRLGAAAVLRERDQQRAPVRRPERLAARQGRDQRLRRRRRRRRGQPGPHGHQGRRPPRAGDAAPGEQRLDPRAPDRARLDRPGDALGADFDRVLEARRDEADQFYATVIPPTLARRRGDGDAPGAGRAAVGQAVLRVRRAPLAARARRQPVGPERRRQLGAQRPVVPHGRGRRHLDARQVGVPVVRGVGPGLPLRAARRWWTSTSPSSRSSCCSAPGTCTRTARSRRTSGTSATSTRPSRRGRRCTSTSARPRSAARAIASSWPASSSGC